MTAKSEPDEPCSTDDPAPAATGRLKNFVMVAGFLGLFVLGLSRMAKQSPVPDWVFVLGFVTYFDWLVTWTSWK
ncbi:MAG: hypothetical protein JNM56_22390 [Planctomycetia bacterium]|nr:hypothetical protein [Planctomycetia bacterium]